MMEVISNIFPYHNDIKLEIVSMRSLKNTIYTSKLTMSLHRYFQMTLNILQYNLYVHWYFEIIMLLDLALIIVFNAFQGSTCTARSYLNIWTFIFQYT
jgi:hypothetical protein